MRVVAPARTDGPCQSASPARTIVHGGGGAGCASAPTPSPRSRCRAPRLPPVPCEALTQTGGPCRRADGQHAAVDGVVRRLCGTHARMARRGPIALWTVPGSEAAVIPRGAVPWSAAEDAYVLANLEATPAEVAGRLGRSEWVVRQRRGLLWRERGAKRELRPGPA